MGVRSVVERGVGIYLLECAASFGAPYPAGDTAHKMLPSAVLARASLLLLERLCRQRAEPPPHAIITNDWVCGLVAPYARHPGWAGSAARGLGYAS